jgi:hypothetical protein
LTPGADFSYIFSGEKPAENFPPKVLGRIGIFREKSFEKNVLATHSTVVSAENFFEKKTFFCNTFHEIFRGKNVRKNWPLQDGKICIRCEIKKSDCMFSEDCSDAKELRRGLAESRKTFCDAVLVRFLLSFNDSVTLFFKVFLSFNDSETYIFSIFQQFCDTVLVRFFTIFQLFCDTVLIMFFLSFNNSVELSS